MSHFPPTNEPFPEPVNGGWLSNEDYEAIHKAPTGYTDVALRGPNDEFFFPIRNKEPELGKPWFIGGRQNLGESSEASATRIVATDTSLQIDPSSFTVITNPDVLHSTPGETPRARHAKDTILTAKLKPEEVVRLNKAVTDGTLRGTEYKGAIWHKLESNSKDLPPLVREFLRAFFGQQVMIGALHDMAKAEDASRSGTSEQ